MFFWEAGTELKPTVQFDPANMCIWYTPMARKNKGESEVLDAIARDILTGRHDGAVQRIRGLADYQLRVRAANLASSIWHEQRHFADVLLTNFGQSIFRQFSSLLFNCGNFLESALRWNEPLPLPITILADGVRARAMGIKSPPEDVVKVAKNVRNRQRMLEVDTLPYGKYRIPLGGRGQLEALGYLTQSMLLIHAFGPDMALPVSLDVLDPEVIRREYLAMLSLGQSLGVAPESHPYPELAPKSMTVIGPAMAAFFYGTLMVRRWGQAQTEAGGGNSAYSSGRLDPLLVHLEDKRALSFARTTIEAWEIVDKSCELIFGRSATNELRADLLYEEDFVEQIAKRLNTDSAIKKYLTGIHEARRRLVDIFIEDPAIILNPERFWELSNYVYPVPIVVDDQGSQAILPAGWNALWTKTVELPTFGRQEWRWGSAPLNDILATKPHVNTVIDARSWINVVTELMPLVKVLIHGRRYPTMLDAELEEAERFLSALGVNYKFDPLLAEPIVDSSTARFWYVTDRPGALCDFCGVEVMRGLGLWVDARRVRGESQLCEWVYNLYGADELASLYIMQDQSGYLACNKCADTIRDLTAGSR